MSEDMEGISLKKPSTDGEDFTPSKGLTSREAEELLRVHGKNQLEDKKTPKVRMQYLARVIGHISDLFALYSYIVAYISATTLGTNAYHDLDSCHH